MVAGEFQKTLLPKSGSVHAWYFFAPIRTPETGLVGGRSRRWRSGLLELRLIDRCVGVDLRPFVGAISFGAHDPHCGRNFHAARVAVVFVKSILGERSENA